MAGQSKRLVGVDVLRAIAIIAVLAEHWRESALSQAPHTWIAIQAWRMAGMGGYGVILFFAISGFVITRTVIERDGALSRMHARSFYIRRVARIGPALALFLVLGIAALSIVPRNSPAAIFVLYGNAPFTSAFWLSIPTFTFNFEAARAALAGYRLGWNWVILWSLSVEEQFYLFFPLLAHLAKRRTRIWMALLCLVLLGSLSRWAIEVWVPEAWPFLTPACLDVIAIGVAAALLPKFGCSREWALRGAAIGIVCLVSGFPSPWFVAKSLLIAVAASLVMLCCQNGEVFTHRVWAPLARIGRVSYGMYLFHPLVLLGLSPVLHGMPFLPGLLLFVAASTVAAEISFAVVERPASRWIRGLWQRREQRSALVSVPPQIA